ncbi:MAG: FkbM family methyltransferase [Oscillospiraceae bacterium]|nr:FkbM family methyltransferase [Oscillospiraceae bacterium]
MNYIDDAFYELAQVITSADAAGARGIMADSFRGLAPELRQGVAGYFARYGFWGESVDEAIGQRADTLMRRDRGFIWLYDRLADWRSKFILTAFLQSWLAFRSPALGSAVETLFPEYFDLDVFNFGDGEVFVDCGVYGGENILDFIKVCPDYKHIYGFEAEAKNFERCKSNLRGLGNITLYNKCVYDTATVLRFTEHNDLSSSRVGSGKDGAYASSVTEIEAVAIDAQIQEKISFIKMDIEGAEMKALAGAKSHIINEKPKLAISVYHGNTDILDVPNAIDDYRDDYKFHLRYRGGDLIASELTLLAV